MASKDTSSKTGSESNAPADDRKTVDAVGTFQEQQAKGYAGYAAKDLTDGRLPDEVDPAQGSSTPNPPAGHPDDPTVGRITGETAPGTR